MIKGGMQSRHPKQEEQLGLGQKHRGRAVYLGKQKPWVTGARHCSKSFSHFVLITLL